MELKKPKHLSAGDTIATVSISHAWAGERDMLRKHELGKKRLEDIFRLNVQAAPNSMKGFEYLKNNPRARAEDIIKNNPKIFIGYSDIMNVHLLCYKAGLSTFYGHNLLTTITVNKF